MVMRHLTVIAYDISDNRRRRKVSDLLEGFGERANYSVFECLLSIPQLDRLIPQLAELIDPKTDSVLAYRVCAGCYGRSLRIGLDAPQSGAVRTV